MEEKKEMGKRPQGSGSRRTFWEVLRNAFRTIDEDEYRAFEQVERRERNRRGREDRIAR